MAEQRSETAAQISRGRNAEIGERFGFRSFREFVYKKTGQGDLSISVYYPYDWKEGDRRPGILFFFGGGFRVGTRHQFVRQATYLAGRGVVAATADYRVAQYHGTGILECITDACSAVKWFRNHADELGIDPERVAVGGGSAGGTVAAASAVLRGFDEPGEPGSAVPDALVLFNPALGLERIAEGRGGRSPEEARIHFEEIGGTDEVLKRITMTDKLTPDLPPTYMWFGTDDKLLIPARSFIDTARSRGCRIDLDLAEGADHGYFNDYEPFFSNSLRSVDLFLGSLGYVDGLPTITACR